MQTASMENCITQLQQQAATMASEALLWKQKFKKAEGMLAAVTQGHDRAALARAYNAGFSAGIEEGSMFLADCVQEQLRYMGQPAQCDTGAIAPAVLDATGATPLSTPRQHIERQTQEVAVASAAKKACPVCIHELCLQQTTPQQCSRGPGACAGPAQRPAAAGTGIAC